MMLGGANFLATGRRQAAPRGVAVLSASATWPVRWTAGGCAAWMGRDGAFVPDVQLCQTITAGTWQWLFPVTDPSGALFGKPNDQYTNLDELLANPSLHGGMLRVDGQLARIYAGPSSAWCGYNPGGTFVCLPGVHPPNATSAGQICYRLGVRCERLLLVQNAACAFNGGDCVFDLSHARIRQSKPEHGFECGACETGRSCLRNDFSNGERPLLFDEGPDWAPSTVPGQLPGDGHGLHYWPVTPTGGPIAAPGGGVAMTGGVAMDGSSVGAFLRKREWHGRFWSEPLEATIPAAEHVVDELENQVGIAQRLTGMDETTDDMPFPDGTALDMVLLCRTWYWFKKRGVKLDGPGHTRNTYNWDHVSKGYFDTQVCGHFFQLAPAVPA